MTIRTRRGRSNAQVVTIAWILIAFLAGCAAKMAPAPPIPETLEPYRVGTPDLLRVTILPEPLIEREVVVRPDGRITLELIGDIQAAGRTTDDIAEEIAWRIEEFKLGPSVSVVVEEARSVEVTVLGAVGREQTITLQRATRVIEAIGRVGGTDDFASRGDVRIIRAQGEEVQIIPVDLTAIEAGDLRTNVLLTGGDVIVVPPNVFGRLGTALSVIFFPFRVILSPIRGLGPFV